ncbi:MAG: valine--tRNA ligase, partial [Clostridiales bacterium]|nr:valine--tRNA ligase [Clostridiales bacterium]
EIPIIADEYVEKDFGTGAVKITPAHDPNDFEVGKRHDLPSINIMNGDATLNENAGVYAGLDRYDARKKILSDLKEQGYLVKTEDHLNNVGHCYRCGNTIEPLVSKQWFVKMKELARPAIDAVKKKEIHFIPKRFEKSYLHWMENTQDWCISRQLWWGHRIPVFYCESCGKMTASKTDITTCPHCGGKVHQDEDVLDTWFSSALWPFSTMGWPENTEMLKYFYPTDALITGYDIIGFWVSRMIFSGLKHTGKKPFTDVVIHGIVRDDKGRKMSKSLGNGVDPLEVVESTGADALRIALVSGISAGGDIKWSSEKLEGYRNFMNKIWNAARFVLMNADGCTVKEIGSFRLTLADKWILGELNRCVKRVTRLMDKYEIGLASAEIYDFIWSNFCDWYIELCKTSLYSDNLERRDNTISVLLYVLREILKLAHPIIPFITAEIYNALPNKDAEDIMVSRFPEPHGIVTGAKILRSTYRAEIAKMGSIMELIKNIRTMRSEMNVSQSRRTALFVKPLGDRALIKNAAPYIEKLACGSSIEIVDTEPEGRNVTVISSIAEVYIPMNELIDKEKEIARLTHELEVVESEIARASGKLANEGFVKKAPAALIEAEKAKLTKYEDQRITLIKSIENLK